MNPRRLIILFGLLTLFSACQEDTPRPIITLVPWPAEVKESKGLFTLTSNTQIEISPSTGTMQRIAAQLTNHTSKTFGYTNSVVATGSSSSRSTIYLTLNESLNLGKENYHLVVKKKEIHIEASSPNGIFYGVQSLLQLMPSTPKMQNEVVLPTLEINDSPRFGWRGLQLDVSRHFMPKSFILKFIDEMAMHKLNVLQLHLADDQGWRLEVRRFPRLTEVGSIRKQTITGHINHQTGIDTLSAEGYYSQNDIREIVSYASDRYVTIVPAIEMPGHALAALASYPELGCTQAPYEVGTRWGLYSDTYCPGNEQTYSMLKGILIEVASIFPSHYIHIGGAEAPTTRWERCSTCQTAVKEDSLESTEELQHYFVRKITASIDSMGRDPMGWDDMLQDTLLTRGTIVAWKGEKQAVRSVRRKLQTILSPARYYNFDQYQSDPHHEPLAVGGHLTLENVYQYEPIPAPLTTPEYKYILGIQANIWTEYMKTPEYVEYMSFPRAAAFAEVGWSPKAIRNYPWFKKRMREMAKRYEAQGIKYCKEEFKSMY